MIPLEHISKIIAAKSTIFLMTLATLSVVGITIPTYAEIPCSTPVAMDDRFLVERCSDGDNVIDTQACSEVESVGPSLNVCVQTP